MTRKTLLRGRGLVAMSFFFLLAPLLPAASAPVEVRPELGLGGWVVPGSRTMLRVKIAASGPLDGALLVEIPGPTRAEPVTRHLHELRLPAGGEQQIVMDVVIRDPRHPLTLSVTSAGKHVARAEVPIGVARSVEGIVVALTDEPAGLEFLASARRRLRPAYVTERDLPIRWQSYEGVDLLVVRDLDPRALGPEQQRAIVEWIAQGGRMLVTVHAGLDLRAAAWIADLLPVDPPSFLTQFSGPSGSIPVPVAHLLARPGATAVTPEGWPPGVMRRFGRGTVEVWGFDPFAPEARAWPGRLRMWRSLLDEPRETPLPQDELATLLPQTRPLPGSTQAALAVLSALYVIAVRLALRRLPAVRATAALGGLVIGFGLVLFSFAAGARGAATSLSQISLLEAFPGTGLAQATTYASLITPYGGTFRLQVPRDAVAVALSPVALTVDETRGELEGTAAGGSLTFKTTQIIALAPRAAAKETAEGLQVTLEIREHPPAQTFLYRGREIYRLPDPSPRTPVRVDPARWEPLERAGLPPLLTAAITRLDRPGHDTLWLLALVEDEEVGLRFGDRRAQSVVQMLVLPVPVR